MLPLLLALAALAGTFACLGGAGVVAGVTIANVLDELDRRRDSTPPSGRIGEREHGGVPAARVLVLPVAGPPPPGEGARVPGLRPPGRAVDTSSRRH